MKIYGSMLCKDCVECRVAYDRAGVAYTFLDITQDLPMLKEFLHLRDTSDLFDAVKENKSIGIPCIVKDDGAMTLDWEALLPRETA